MLDDHYPSGGMRFVHVVLKGRQNPQIRKGPFRVRGNGCLIKPEFFVQLEKTPIPLLPGLGLANDVGLIWVRPTFAHPGGEFAGLMAAMRPASVFGTPDLTLFVVVEFMGLDMEHVHLRVDQEFCGSRSIPSLWIGLCSRNAVLHIQIGSLHHRLINREGKLISEDQMRTKERDAAGG